MSRFLAGIRTSISIKLLLLSELLLIFTVFLILLSVLPEMRDQIVLDIQNRSLAIAKTAALQLDGDALKTIRTPADVQTPAFTMLRAQLLRVRLANQLGQDNIYTFYLDPSSAARVRFGVMTHEAPFVGDLYPIRQEMLLAFANGNAVSTGLYHDQFGQWISAYAPVFDSRGAVVGILDVNEKADAYFASYNRAKWLAITLATLVLIASSIIGWIIVSNIVMKPMRAVHAGMHALRRSEFNHRVELTTGDEFESLGETFNKLARELNAARQVQDSFAPKDIPSRNGWAIAAHCQPCDATAGDYVDAFELPDGRIAVVVADVTGHGLAPALLMSACRSTLRALAGLNLSPADVVDRINAMIMNDLTGGRFITMIFGILESDGRFVYCNAGHGPALALCGGPARVLGAHRPPVGLDWPRDPAEAGQSVVVLQPGQRLLLASDGVTEAFSQDDELFGDARLIEIAADAGTPHHEVIKRICAAVVKHRGTRDQADDITILCIDRV